MGLWYCDGPFYHGENLRLETVGLAPQKPYLLAALGKVLGKEIAELAIFVLEKPRHRALIDQIRELGAEVTSFPAGDVAGSLLSALPNSGIDAMMGTGGIREGILSACAARALGAE
ncbi:MAG: fructose-bisphosphatase class II, partial [Candidatus Dadabacteria bacterium]|nr:fructose-bisphosphatase class II [Candidatus Dadabacteria bacterium]